MLAGFIANIAAPLMARRYLQRLEPKMVHAFPVGNIVSLKRLLVAERGHSTDMAERLRGLGKRNPARLRNFCFIETAPYARFPEAFYHQMSADVCAVAA